LLFIVETYGEAGELRGEPDEVRLEVKERSAPLKLTQQELITIGLSP
jgi:hypothetical protein